MQSLEPEKQKSWLSVSHWHAPLQETTELASALLRFRLISAELHVEVNNLHSEDCTGEGGSVTILRRNWDERAKLGVCVMSPLTGLLYYVISNENGRTSRPCCYSWEQLNLKRLFPIFAVRKGKAFVKVFCELSWENGGKNNVLWLPSLSMLLSLVFILSIVCDTSEDSLIEIRKHYFGRTDFILSVLMSWGCLLQKVKGNWFLHM